MSSEPLLRVSDLHVAYGGVVAVRGLDLEVDAGRLALVLGANGAGKTSTLRAISGLVPATGEVSYGGTPIRGLRPEAIARLGVAHVPAGRGVLADLTVAENLLMGWYGAGRRRGSEFDAAVADAVAVFPILGERMGQRAGTLSGGQQQQLSIGRALIQRPRLLLVDEMSMGLAPLVVEELFAAIARLRDDGLAVVLVEQFVGEALRVADHVTVLEQGVVSISGEPSELREASLAGAYLGAGKPTAREPEVGPDADAAVPRQRVTIRLPGRQVRDLERLAADSGRDVDAVVSDLVSQRLEPARPARKPRARRTTTRKSSR